MRYDLNFIFFTRISHMFSDELFDETKGNRL